MAGVENKGNVSDKVNEFLTRYRRIFFVIIGIIVVALVVYSVSAAVYSNFTENALTKIDTITYNLTNDSQKLSADELSKRRTAATKEATPYLNKGGIVGVRANMLVADISYENKDFAAAEKYWVSAAEAKKNVYTSPLSYFNAAVCYEETKDTTNAIKYYQLAADAEDFMLSAHALFNLGRLQENASNFDAAQKSYQKIIDNGNGGSWGNLAKSRILALKADKKIK